MRQLLASLVVILLWTCSCAAQETLRPGRLSKEELAALVPGVQWQFFSPADAKEPVDSRIDRVTALYVPAQEPATPFMPAGAFAAQLSGVLKVALKGEHTLRMETLGSATLLVNGVETLRIDDSAQPQSKSATIALVKGYNRFEVRYRSLADGAAKLRLFWAGSDFVEEPLPTDALFTRDDDALLKASTAQRVGRELFATRSCRQCHTLDGIQVNDKAAMPELSFAAPSLAGVGNRLQPQWMAAWILEPEKLRPTATMPRMLHGDKVKTAQEATDLAAYLSTLKMDAAKPVDAPATDAAELVDAGLKLYEGLGCIACHHTQEPATEDAHARRSLHFLKTKFAPGALSSFLQQPHEHYAWSRMPNFKLSAEEATALTAYLHSQVKGELAFPQDAPIGDANRGQALFTTVGCAQCHATDLKSTPTPKLAVVLKPDVKQAGCLATDDVRQNHTPQFLFTDEQRTALTSFLATDRRSLLRETPAEFSQRQVAALHCVACHRRDGAGSVLTTVLQDESELGVTPEILPSLSWAGEKLKPQWSARLFTGQHDQRARHWLKARMPAFPARAEMLALGLSHEHGVAADENPQPPHDKNLAEMGAKLVGDAGGFSCIKCHAIGKQPPLAPFEAPGINLVDAGTRLRHMYYPRWMMDPPRVDVSTKMPKFSADGRTTGVTLFDGDAERQYNALWHYIQSLQH